MLLYEIRKTYLWYFETCYITLLVTEVWLSNPSASHASVRGVTAGYDGLQEGFLTINCHKCKKAQLFQVLIDFNNEEGEGLGEQGDLISWEESNDVNSKGNNGKALVVEEPVISFHAMLGLGNCKTLKLQGKIKKHSVVMLLNIGSTHNFISVSSARQLKCKLQPMAKMKVMAANGEAVSAQAICLGLK
ncbi:Retrotransposon gag protein [Quillaja saponaria]|uniref:Retrotransposon gag protein n=1 Tax=Quillaja saponaria TaxID=32244 RepID=A0AAD7P8V7_QUISA|nr:Retrotransposon gag protein [Quillaja saponaria]